MRHILPKLPESQALAAARALPGVQPVVGNWITVDGAYAAQIAEKQRLLHHQPDDVRAVLPGAEAPVQECLSLVVEALDDRDDFAVSGDQVRCPDGRDVMLDAAAPLNTLSQLIQEDICILQRQGAEHVLTAALLCFPASWTLAEKLGRPLIRIHAPVPDYADDIARRVQRLFDGVRAGRPIWRANLLRYDDPALFQPRTEGDARPIAGPHAGYLRSERQTILRLPQTDAVVFAIHTAVTDLEC